MNSALVTVTFFSPDWLERLFVVELDGGNGALEWAAVVLLLVLSITFAAPGRAEWNSGATVAAR